MDGKILSPRTTLHVPIVPAVLAVAVFLLVSLPHACAHHILGIPHYSYDEQYPQAPVLTYLVDAGPLEVRMTGYPGKPKPGERCTLNVYIQRKDDGSLFEGKVTGSVLRRTIGTDRVVYGPVVADLEDAVYKFYPHFEVEANYLFRIEFEIENAPWIIDLPMVAGEPGSPWAVLGGALGAVALFLIVIRAIRIKVRRRQPESATPAEGRAQ